MNVIYFTKYVQNAGSSRLRSYQYFPFLEENGVNITVKPLFNEKYLRNLYSNKSVFIHALSGYLKRLYQLLTIYKYDRIVIEKELFPYFPAWFERILKLFHFKYIVDYDDAIYHNYDLHPNKIIRHLFNYKIAHVMRCSQHVVVGNQYLAEYAHKHNAQNIHIIPTVVDLKRYPLKQFVKEKESFIIGWIGSKSTFEKYLLPCKDWIKELQLRNPNLYLHIIGISDDMNMGINTKYIPWSETTEVKELQKIDVGIMPLKDSLWERGKCAYKLIQYFACGIPGIASDVGMNKKVVIDNKTGFIARNQDDWIRYIELLMNDVNLRKLLGHQARELVEDEYSLQKTQLDWLKIIKN